MNGIPLYETVPSPFGRLAVAWREGVDGPLVLRVFLPLDGMDAVGACTAAYPGVERGSNRAVGDICEGIREFLGGKPVGFGLAAVALEECSPFQRKVLEAEWRIPRGMVSTYGRIARRVGVPGGARAVGRALARNPFPIIVPCHRAVRSDGGLGGFQGGTRMKRALLEMEGVGFSAGGKVLDPALYF